MYFRFSDFYKRDTTFAFNREKSSIDLYVLQPGQLLSIDKPLEFDVDRIDKYIESYDLLPTFNTPLVSARFKELFNDLIDDLQFVDATIIDKKGNTNENFYFMNILNVLPLMDKDKSVFDIRKRGTAELISIKKLYTVAGSLKEHHIARMKEHSSYIMVTEEFKKRCEGAGLKGIDFIEEGYSIYS